VAENVGYRLYEETDMPTGDVRRRVMEVLSFMGLSEYIDRMPASLSGGQRRRVAIARAMAARPRLLLFDDPTTGLDPITATTVDDEILKLRDVEHVTSMVVTHQIRDAYYMATHEIARSDGQLRIVNAGDATAAQVGFMVLHEGVIHFEGSAMDLLSSRSPFLQQLLYKPLPPY